MRVLIAKHYRPNADYRCDSREGKRLLNEVVVTTLLISYVTGGRDNGLEVLKWAARKGCLPPRIELIDHNLDVCKKLSTFLTTKGYKAFNERQFIRVH